MPPIRRRRIARKYASRGCRFEDRFVADAICATACPIHAEGAERWKLYVSEEFSIAIHLCACGCGAKIKTPLGLTEWNVTETATGPTPCPSIGNWQQRCQSHYIISSGNVQWAPRWTWEQIACRRRYGEARQQSHHDEMYKQRTRFGRFLRNAEDFVRRAKAFFQGRQS